jgi:hypothetical protein
MLLNFIDAALNIITQMKIAANEARREKKRRYASKCSKRKAASK